MGNCFRERWKMRNKGKNNIILSLSLTLILTLVTAKSRTERNVKVRRRSPFKIALFADLHFGENAWSSWGPLQDVQSVNVMSSLLHLEKPDFVVYLGDVITANNIATATATATASRYWDMALSPTREKGITWASVFGNHDDALFEWPLEWFSGSGIPPFYCPSTISEDCSFKGTSRLELMDHEVGSNKLSFTVKGPRELWPSVSNFVIGITSSHDSKPPVAYLYFLDSGGGSYPEVISNSQAKWFNSTSQELNRDARVPEIIFWHIPSRAYNNVAPSGKITNPCVGTINKERVAPQESEFGIMKALEARPSVQAVFVGHNHGLDWCCPYITSYDFALHGTLAMVAMEIGLEELGFLRLPSNHFLSCHGLQWKMVRHIVELS